MIDPEDLQVEADLLTLHLQDMFKWWYADHHQRTGLHASSLIVADGEWCARRWVLLGDEKDTPSPVTSWRSAAILAHGWSLHEKWQRLLARYGRLVEVEQAHYDPTYNLYYTPDAILEFAGKQYVIEIKGYNTTAYDKMVSPLGRAVDQAQLYMHLLQMDRAIVLVEHKDSQDFKLWVIAYDPEHVQKYLDRALVVKQAKEHGFFPARVCTSVDSNLARRCPMRAKCFAIPAEAQTDDEFPL